jgi:hypothetical protein
MDDDPAPMAEYTALVEQLCAGLSQSSGVYGSLSMSADFAASYVGGGRCS